MASFLGLLRVLFVSLLVSSVVAAGCEKPKVRREWRKLTPRERQEWIKAVNCLDTLPHDPKLSPIVPGDVSVITPINKDSTFYDDLVYMHMDLNTKVHFTGLFLPWHRQYVQYFEDVLTGKCGYNGVMPYWDWTLDAADFQNSAFFDTSSFGVGGWGDPENDFQITDGGFKDMVRVYPTSHHIRRNYSNTPFTNPNILAPWGNAPDAPPRQTGFQVSPTLTRANVDFVINGFEGNYNAMQAYVDSTNGTHIGIHLIMGADLTGLCTAGAPSSCVPGAKWTPNDPLFFLHHAFVDKNWHDWQNKSAANKNAYGGGTVQALDTFANFRANPNGLAPLVTLDTDLPGDGLWSDVKISDVMDTQAGKLCYTYA